MQTIAQDIRSAGTITSSARSRLARRVGRVLSGMAVAFLIFDGLGKLLEVQPVVDGTKQLGYPPGAVFTLGVILLSCLLVHLVPKTSVLGALLLTGYLGGAVATHLRVGSPLLTHVLFPVYMAAVLWGGLLLRDTRLHAVLPWRNGRQS